MLVALGHQGHHGTLGRNLPVLVLTSLHDHDAATCLEHGIGTIVSPDRDFDRIREITRRHGTILIHDETHTICAGPGGYTKRYGLDPDLQVLALRSLRHEDAVRSSALRGMRLQAQDQVHLADAVAHCLREDVFPILIGGGHETSYGHFLGYVQAERDVHLLNWDAHADVLRVLDAVGELSSHVQETVSGVRLVKASGAEPWEIARFNRLTQSHYAARVRDERWRQFFPPATEMVIAVSILGLLWYGSFLVLEEGSLGAAAFLEPLHQALDLLGTATGQ